MNMNSEQIKLSESKDFFHQPGERIWTFESSFWSIIIYFRLDLKPLKLPSNSENNQVDEKKKLHGNEISWDWPFVWTGLNQRKIFCKPKKEFKTRNQNK